MKNRPSPIGGAILAILIGLNLRPIMASISPLLKILQSDLTLDSRQASLLTTFPVMMMGLFALAGAWLQRRMGRKKRHCPWITSDRPRQPEQILYE